MSRFCPVAETCTRGCQGFECRIRSDRRHDEEESEWMRRRDAYQRQNVGRPAPVPVCPYDNWKPERSLS